ncbi:hypothetical protein JB92DRAFT_2957596 [Gautieria morchelliformis]|nr:hypothetical protein JB92DRAFT_2957596 [Gautieria morchelliformis]
MTTPADVSLLEATFGTLYIGSIFATILYGFTTDQAFRYFRRYWKSDGLSIQSLVLGLWIIDSFQVVLVVHMSWFYLVEGFGKLDLLERLVWSFSLEVGITVLVTFIVRAFYLMQLWILSDKNLLIVAPAFVFATAQLALGMLIAGDMLRHPTITIVSTKTFQAILATKCVTSVLADVIITLSLCYFLHFSRTGLTRTNELVNSLLIYTINRGVLAMLMEAAVMITYLAMEDNYLFAALHLMLGKLHTSSLFSLLLQRDTLRKRQSVLTTNTFSHSVAPQDPNIAHLSPPSSHDLSHDMPEFLSSEDAEHVHDCGHERDGRYQHELEKRE